jgi:hypothetical protein
MYATKINITQEMVDAVFGDPILCKKFKNPELSKRVCELRLTGLTFKEVEKVCKLPHNIAYSHVYKLKWIYQLFSEDKQ